MLAGRVFPEPTKSPAENEAQPVSDLFPTCTTPERTELERTTPD